jgi:large subunit ribosomal protein L35
VFRLPSQTPSANSIRSSQSATLFPRIQSAIRNPQLLFLRPKKFRLPIGVVEIHSGLLMPKPIARRKTKKAVAKRFKVTATGKVLRGHAGRRHLLQSKNAKRKRQLAKQELTATTAEARIKKNLPFN